MILHSALLLLLTLILTFGCGCDRDKAIKIGFVGSITGKNSDLGVAERDAVLLAVENVNSSGGINGRMLALSVRDDAFSPELAAKAVDSLAGEKVTAIIGPTGSSMAKAALPVAARNNIVMVSPTSTTNELSGKDDYFFRVMEPNLLFARHLAETCIKLKIKRVAAIYDLQNKTYTVEIFQEFKDEFTRRGGTIGEVQSFDSARSPVFMPLVQKLGLENADGVMVLASSVDSINIGQQIRKVSPHIPILSGACGIAQRDLVQQAGKSIDNIIFTMPVNTQCAKQSYTSFRDAFFKRFNYQPTFAAVLAYDAAQAVVAGLRKNPDPERFRETMKGIRSFTGLQGDVDLDPYGDPHRNLYILRYAEGREEVVE
ncbi:MAG TPA: ABC transporter substrate-binding protein [Geobacteraceae bacterium]|nr:ABC transporter substrate-binding protein [Geobacteraceae bacterium]